jgi:hypothetical protein
MFAKIKNNIEIRLEDNPWSLAGWIIGSLLMLATLVGRLNWWNEKLSAAIFAGITSGTSGMSVKPWLLYLIDIVVGTIATLSVLLLQTEYGRRKAIRGKSETSTIAHKTLLGMMRAANRIRHQSFPLDPSKQKSYVSIDNTYLVNKDFTTEITRRYQIRAVSTPIHFLEMFFWANDDADPKDYLDDIDFKITSNSEGKDVVYLPIVNEKRRKSVVLYFLPPLDPADPEPRTVSIKYTWPRMLAQLDRIGQEKFEWAYDSVDPIGKVKISYFLEEGTGKKFECEIAGPDYGVKPSPAKSPKGWPGYIYEVTNAPAGHSEYALELRLKKP